MNPTPKIADDYRKLLDLLDTPPLTMEEEWKANCAIHDMLEEREKHP